LLPASFLHIFTAVKKQLLLKKHEDKRIRNGHLWVFSNEVKELRGGPEAGDVAELRDHSGKFLGVGFFHPHSLITLRLLSQENEPIDFHFFEQRIHRAWEVRQKLYPKSDTYRLVHGESDFLPGLVIDRYEQYFSVQTFSYGMDKRLTLICDVLDSLFHPKGIVERNESTLRTLEGLEERKGILRGTISQVVINEGDVRYEIDLLEGQKTGFYLDQRENRMAIRRYAKGAVVLDCFCNDGGFGLHAARAGAKEVAGVDVSASAIKRATHNTGLNSLQQTCHYSEGDVFEFLLGNLTKVNATIRGTFAKSTNYDLIILDPPSFTKSKKNVAAAKRGYKEINTHAMQLLSKGGMLATASCSHHITREMFLEILTESAKEAGRKVRLLEFKGAAPDHPVLPAMPETEYLKFVILETE
jgi:23S rRNA (cytosine1962-C5)-methyltransferase